VTFSTSASHLRFAVKQLVASRAVKNPLLLVSRLWIRADREYRFAGWAMAFCAKQRSWAMEHLLAGGAGDRQ
jgi:hypothetical protein